MNKQQQELYEKLLKKVNEFCLGQAAEDVIEAIDNLVDNYETQTKALEIIKNKRVDAQLLKDSKNLNEYNWCAHTKDRALTQEKYELLKEVLK